MFRLTAARLAVPILIGQLAATAVGEETGACDATSGECSVDAGDAMSAMQLGKPPGKGGKKGSKPQGAWNKNKELEQQAQAQYEKTGQYPGYNKYWELVNASDIASVLPFSEPTGSKGIPSCLQGIFYMDQQCLTYPYMKSKNKKMPCLGGIYPYAWVNEYVTSFGSWNGRKKCFTAERKAWTFGQGNISSYVCSGNGIRACQTNADKYGPCDVGAKFGSTNLGSSFWDQWYFIKTAEPNGWLRQTPHSQYMMPKFTYYPVQQVVDANGNQTKWFKHYYKEAIRTKCPYNAKMVGGPRGCRKSQWASTGQIARCTRGTVNFR